VETVARIGAIFNYKELYQKCLEFDYKLINSPEQHQLASELEHWYPHISDLTPKSKIYEDFPSLSEFYKTFKFPVFIKGNRQTAKHNPELAIAHSEDDFHRIQKMYQQNNILHWQKIVVRELESLKRLDYQVKDKVPLSFEFRTFWWRKELVGYGHYWSQYIAYHWTIEQQNEAIAIAQKAAQRLDVNFLAIDLALTTDDRWIIIECNDAQESGYCGLDPIPLWKRIIEKEKKD